MRTKDLSPYETIFSALIKDGFSEHEAEELLCEVIEDQKGYDNIAERIHKMIEEEIKNPKNWN